jgi:AAA family ATP:ADP antiporter
LRPAAGAFVCVASAGIFARSAGSALFLTRYGAAQLPYLYLASAVLLLLVFFGFSWLGSRHPVRRLIAPATAVLVILCVALRVALLLPWKGVSAAAYVVSEIVARVPVLLFWSFAALLFNPREARRIFVVIGAAGTVACAAAGALIRGFARPLGTENLFLIVAALVAGFGVFLLRVGRVETAAGGGVARVEPLSSFRASTGVARLPQVRGLAMLLAASTVTLVLTDFLFKSGARARFAGADLAGFFGSFYSATSVVTLFFQLFLVHRVLQRGGVLPALGLLPLVLAAAGAGVAATGRFEWIVAAKFADPVLDFTLHATGLQLLYLGIRRQSRSQARAFAEGIGRPAAMALAGMLLLTVARKLTVPQLGLAISAASLLWLFLAWKNYRTYVAGLLDSIGARRFDLSQETVGWNDPLVERHLRESLRTAPDGDVPYLLGLVPDMAGGEWVGEYRDLLRRPLPEIKVVALEFMREKGDETDAAAILDHLTHPDATVRKAALHAAAAKGGAAASGRMKPLLEDPDPEVRGSAVAELMNMGDLDALLVACIALKLMLGSPEETSRAAAASALASVRNEGLSRPLSMLLADREPVVRLAALSSCRRRPNPELIGPVIELLADPRVALEAADTLSAFGPAVLDHFGSFPEEACREPIPDSRFFVPGILAATGDPRALPILEKALDTPNVQLRGEVVSAFVALLQRGWDTAAHRKTLAAAARRAIEEARHRVALARELDDFAPAKILCDVLREEHLELLKGAFAALEGLHPGVDMKSVLSSLTGSSAERRAGALEVLDNVLDKSVKESLLAIFEPRERAAPAASRSEARLAELLEGSGSEWVTACAVYTTGEHSVRSSLEAVRGMLHHASPFVRETALHAYRKLADPEDRLAESRRMSDDPSPSVRALAREIAFGGRMEAGSQ